jgi:hypothetical protein
VREDFLDEKKALDEVLPYIFGVPQMVENDSFDRSVASASSVHVDCMSVRREWMRWFFGDKPNLEEVMKWKKMSNDQKFEEGILRLRRGAQYEPTEEEIGSGKFKSSMLTINDKQSLDEDVCEKEMLYLHMSDIYQRYAESCYDPNIRQTTSMTENIDEIVKTITLSSDIDSLDLREEVQKRETLYRMLKVFQAKQSPTIKDDAGENVVVPSEQLDLQRFHGLLNSLGTSSPTSFCSTDVNEIIDNDHTSIDVSRESIIGFAKEKLFQQHHAICSRK